jgi:hypothetical protein
MFVIGNFVGAVASVLDVVLQTLMILILSSRVRVAPSPA